MIDHAPAAAAAPPALALIVSINAWNARAIESILDPAAYVTLRATTRDQAVQLARGTSPDIVVIHGDLADTTLDDIVRELVRDDVLDPTCPLIVLSSNGEPRSRRLALQRLGAWHVVTDPIDSETLALLCARLLGARRELRRLMDRVLIDARTGLYNERGLLRRAAEMGARANRLHEPLACIALSPVVTGEDRTSVPSPAAAVPITSHLARVVGSIVRLSDAIGHLPPRELGLVMGADEESAFRLVERARTAVESTPLVMGGAIRQLSIVAAVCAVPDFSQSAVSASALLRRVASRIRDGGMVLDSISDRIVEPVPLRHD